MPLAADGKHTQMIVAVEKGDEIRWISHRVSVDLELQNGTPFAGEVKG